MKIDPASPVVFRRRPLRGGERPLSDTVVYELDGHVATITYNRPDVLNAIDAEMRRGLNAAFERFRADEDAWVAIVTGAGRAFCVGADLQHGAGRGRRVRGDVLGEADAQLVRERVGDLQTRHRGGERVLPRLRADAGVVVRLRRRERAGGVRISRGEHRRADHRRRDPAAAAHQLAVRDGAAAHGRADRCRARRRSASRVGWFRTTTSWRRRAGSPAVSCTRRRSPPARTKEVAVRTQHMSTVEAIRFGETMRRVAAATEDAAEGGRAMREGRPPEWRGR